jgi:hypothetical protein
VNGIPLVDLPMRHAQIADEVDAGFADVHGDDVIVPVNTFIATAEAVVRVGARPVLVDVDDVPLSDPDRGCAPTRTS